MRYHFHFLHSSNFTKEEKELIRSKVSEVLKNISNKITVDFSFDLILSKNEKNTHSDLMIDGSSYKDKFVQIAINIFDFSGKEIEKTLCHELAELIRFKNIKENNSFLESMILDGMAEHFSIEVNKTKQELWTNALTIEDKTKIRERLMESIEYKTIDRNLWFYGQSKKEIPLYAGYTIGFDLVGMFIKENNKTIFDLFSVPTKEFLPYAKKWGIC